MLKIIISKPAKVDSKIFSCKKKLIKNNDKNGDKNTMLLMFSALFVNSKALFQIIKVMLISNKPA